MLCIVTILQNKRVVMPYLFGKYCLPMMRKKFHGDIVLYHVVHDRHMEGSHMASNNQMGSEHVQKVRDHINAGMYPEATIIRHSEVWQDWPAQPSFLRAAEQGIKDEADFHLWIEDDAIIYDRDCNSWAITLGSADTGIYQNTIEKQMINTAYFLSTQEFDKRFVRMLQEFRRNLQIPPVAKGLWDTYIGKGSLIEHCAWRASRKPQYIGPDKAFRHHPHATSKFKKDRATVRAWLEKNILGITTKDLDLLALDFHE